MEHPNNPHWPPDTRPSLAGAAHGLHMNEREGSGLGRCIIVLMGGRSGGHQAAVLGAVCCHPPLQVSPAEVVFRRFILTILLLRRVG